jgi:hypothetical protein
VDPQATGRQSLGTRRPRGPDRPDRLPRPDAGLGPARAGHGDPPAHHPLRPAPRRPPTGCPAAWTSRSPPAPARDARHHRVPRGQQRGRRPARPHHRPLRRRPRRPGRDRRDGRPPAGDPRLPGARAPPAACSSPRPPAPPSASSSPRPATTTATTRSSSSASTACCSACPRRPPRRPAPTSTSATTGGCSPSWPVGQVVRCSTSAATSAGSRCTPRPSASRRRPRPERQGPRARRRQRGRQRAQRAHAVDRGRHVRPARRPRARRSVRRPRVRPAARRQQRPRRRPRVTDDDHALGRLLGRVRQGGFAAVCSCSHHLGRVELDAAVLGAGAGAWTRVHALGPAPITPCGPATARATTCGSTSTSAADVPVASSPSRPRRISRPRSWPAAPADRGWRGGRRCSRSRRRTAAAPPW